jgi:hypothetical protein
MPGDDITIEILKSIRREMRERFDAVDRRFDAVDQRFDAVDQRFETMEERAALMSQSLEITNERLTIVESTLTTLARRQRATQKLLKTAVTDLELRVGRLETR